MSLIAGREILLYGFEFYGKVSCLALDVDLLFGKIAKEKTVCLDLGFFIIF